MGIAEKMNNVGNKIQTSVSSGLFQLTYNVLQIISGFVLGLTLALVAQEIMQFGNFALWFITLTVIGLFWKFTSEWNFVKLLIFDLICVLIGLSLKMYILVAP